MKKNFFNILCTIGPSSLNKNFLKFCKKKVNIVRINLSHVEPHELDKYINFIKKFNINICIDTEGAQIRTKISKPIMCKMNRVYKFKKDSPPYLYPAYVFDKLKVNDYISVGFDDLIMKVIKKTNKFLFCKTKNPGVMDNNKGVGLLNRKIHLNYLTESDLRSIEIAKRHNIKIFALSFTNSVDDIDKFKKLLPGKRLIYKLESKNALKNINEIVNKGKEFLIDRGDLSKETSIYKIPINQREIIKKINKKKNKKIYVATNFLETMIEKPYPTRAEINDIFSSLEMGADGLVLAAETAIGKYPKECIIFLRKTIKEFIKYKK